jgi:hypothetical protein
VIPKDVDGLKACLKGENITAKLHVSGNGGIVDIASQMVRDFGGLGR